MTYNPKIGAPGVRPVGAPPYRRDSDVDLPRTYMEARDAFERADKRRGSARGKLCHNTRIERITTPEGVWKGSVGFGIVLHDTRIVTFNPDDSITLDTGGWQTPTTRDRMNRCGLSVYMSSGVAIVRHAGLEHAYRDGMILHPDGSVSGPPVVGTVAEILSRRRRHLASARRAEKRGDDLPWLFYWPNKRGGESRHKGNVPEVFLTDCDCGLKTRTQSKVDAQTRAISGRELQ